MNQKRSFLFITALLITHLCSSQSVSDTKWYKGNLHTHSLWSDGDDFPEMIMDWYKSHGYNFVALSDHNVLAEGEKWVDLPNREKYKKAFYLYLDKYGDKWVTYKVDSGATSVKLKTLAEYRGLFEDERFLVIQSEEITDSYDRKPIHMNVTNVRALIEPQGGNSVFDVIQRNIDAVMKQRKETGEPMIIHLNHPNYQYSVTADDLIKLRGERFFEVYNGHSAVNNYGDSLHISTEAMWDQVNIAYANLNLPLMFALATDDSHHYIDWHTSFCNPGRGWVMVRASALTPPALIKALEAGDYYASTGVTLDELSATRKNYRIKVHAEPKIEYTIQFIGVKKGESKSKVLQQSKGPEATYIIPPNLLFVRARIISTKPKDNATTGEEVEMAWTQPVH